MNKVKLNLGCGEKNIDGYINVDYFARNPDLRIDLEKLPLPFDSSYADEIMLYSVLEHLWVNPYKFMLEMHRILKKGGIVKIKVPLCYPMLPHVRWFHTKNYFNCLVDFKYNKKKSKTGQRKKYFRYVKRKYHFRRFHWTFPFVYIGLYVELKKI